MSRRHKLLARTHRAQLLLELGNLCVQCGSGSDLTFDCIIPQGHLHHSMDASARMYFYRKQHRAGNIQILCRRCNGRKGAVELAEREKRLNDMPF